MIKKLLLPLLILLVSFNSFSQLQVGDWKLYSAFSGTNIQSIIDTGDIVYYLSEGYLFSYDKENDETVYYNKRNNMSDTDISNIYYNYNKNYLLIAYSNSNIDLLYDDGNIVNVPDLKNIVMSESKAVNDVDFQDDEIYVATDFGYMVVDDEKYLIKESFNYGKKFVSMIATDKYIYACFDSFIWVSPKNENHFYISSFKKTNRNVSSKAKIAKVSNTKMVTYSGYFYSFGINSDDITNLSGKSLKNSDVRFLSKSKNGFIATFSNSYMEINSDCNIIKEVSLPAEVVDAGFVSSMETDGSVWAIDEKGLKQFKMNDNGGVTYLHENYIPNASNVSYPFYMHYQNGRLYTMNSGPTNWLTDQSIDFTLSVDDNGTWKNLAPDNLNGLINSNSRGKLLSPYGLALDPDDQDAVWFGTWWEGAFCVKDNKQIQKFDSKNSPMVYNYICQISNIKFDSHKNMWMSHFSLTGSGEPLIIALPAEKRFSSTVTSSDWVSFYVTGVENEKHAKMIVTSNDVVINVNNRYTASLVAIDFNGTLEDKSDDRQVVISNYVDQDGRTFSIGYIYDIYEDSNGRIWLATDTGVGYINDVNDLFSNNFYINRVKVPRNDGTNLADYLLDGIVVSSIAMDGAGRKWFGTTNSGLYLVSADGTEILEHFTADNSYLPSDMVLSVVCNTDNNSVYVGTDKGLAEYSSDAITAEQNFDNVYAYPNPVRPDYTGYITIRGLMENSLVKIADAAGNVVYSTKSNGGMVVWDGCNTNGKRVDTGVYLVFASQSENDSSNGCVTKILVVR